MTKSSIESEPDVPLVGVAGWLLFMWAISHFLPVAWRAPWSFDGWVSFIFSAASWVVGGLATVAIVMMFVTQGRKPLVVMPLELLGVMAGWGIVFVAFVTGLHFVSDPSIPAHPTMVAGDPLKTQIEKLRERRQKLSGLISDRERDRSSVVRRIRQGNAQAIHAHELLKIDRSLKRLKGEAEDLALTITKGEALLRQTERQRRLRDAGLDSNELAELRVEIEERLESSSESQSACEAIQVDRVIRDAIRGNR